VAVKIYQHSISASAIMLAKTVFPLVFMIAAGLLLTACKQEATTGGGGNPTGVYALVSVNGMKVPANISHDGAAIEVRSGTFTIKADGTCSTKTSFVPPSGTEATREVNATYTKEGSKLTMRWQGAGMTTGTIDGNTFTMNNEGMVLVYKK
jgi:hypothetical protein